MDRYDTPKFVATALARHAPRRIRRLLDPAVGHGVLVEALGSRMMAGNGRALCIDVDSLALGECKIHLGTLPDITAEYLNVDFLKWTGEQQRFDCIIMNPPFGGKKQHEVPLNRSGRFPNSHVPNVASLEAAFVFKAIEMLEPGGRLLAVLPSSVILGQASVWLRQYLCDTVRVTYVHELPQFTFSNLESRVYLLVFERGGHSGMLTLLNHDVRRPFSIRVMRSKLNPELRLDFAFSSALSCLQEAISRTPGLAWTKLGACASILRGRGDSPDGLERSLHTTDFNAENWKFAKKSAAMVEDRSDRGLRRGDLLLKRVGRKCSHTLAQNRAVHNKQCSDCILVIRPSNQKMSTRLLLATRVLLESKIGPPLVERGSGASYITESALESFLIPSDLSSLDVSLYRRYRYAVDRQSIGRIRTIEAEFRQKIGLGIG